MKPGTFVKHELYCRFLLGLIIQYSNSVHNVRVIWFDNYEIMIHSKAILIRI